MAAWGYGLLGPVEVRVDGRAVPLPGARQRLVLTMLLVDFNRIVPAGRLIDELWEAALPADPRGALRTQVSRLRRALGPAGGDLATVEGGYRLAVQRGQLDATRFEDMLAEAARASGRRVRRQAVRAGHGGPAKRTAPGRRRTPGRVAAHRRPSRGSRRHLAGTPGRTPGTGAGERSVHAGPVPGRPPHRSPVHLPVMASLPG